MFLSLKDYILFMIIFEIYQIQKYSIALTITHFPYFTNKLFDINYYSYFMHKMPLFSKGHLLIQQLPFFVLLFPFFQKASCFLSCSKGMQISHQRWKWKIFYSRRSSEHYDCIKIQSLIYKKFEVQTEDKMTDSSKRIFDISMNNRKGQETGLASCFGAFNTPKTGTPEIIDYFEQQYHSEDMRKDDNTGDIKNQQADDFGLCDNPREASDRSMENDVDIIKTETVSKVTLKEMEWDEFSNKPRSFLLEEEMIEEQKILEEEKNEIQEIQVPNKNINEIEMISMKTQSIESAFQGNNIEIHVREVLQSRPKPRKIIKKKSKKTKSEKDETKNTIKNFGKGIIIFVQKQVFLVSKVLGELGSKMDHTELLKKLSNVKNQLSRIQHLKQLWTSEEYGREMRVISQLFLRKNTFSWIFNSRVENVRSPLKYRIRLLEAIQDPENFYSLKWF